MACWACWRPKAKLGYRLQTTVECQQDPLDSILWRFCDDDFSIVHDLQAHQAVEAGPCYATLPEMDTTPHEQRWTTG